MSTQTALVDRIRGLTDAELADVLAELWRRAGWQVDAAVGDQQEVVAHRSDDDGSDAVVLRAATTTGLVNAAAIHTAVDRRDRHDADRVTTVAPTGYTTNALEVAQAYGVDTMDAASLARIVIALGADDLID